MKLAHLNVGVAITGSFCTFEKTKEGIKELVAEQANVYPIFSFNAQKLDTRFGKAKEYMDEITQITSREPILTIEDAEPIGPKGYLDIMVIMPCTGNTLAKLCNGITDTPVLMAAKAHIRGNKPLVIAIDTNDGLSSNFKNIGAMMNTKHIYFVPFGQDDPVTKPNSVNAHVHMILPTIELALEAKQIQPVIVSPF